MSPTRLAHAGIGPKWRCLLLASVSALGLVGHAASASEGELRLLSLNTWIDRFKTAPGGPAAAISDFLVNGKYDILTFQELRSNSSYLATIPGLLESNGLGAATTGQFADTGYVSHLSGESGSHSSGVAISYQTIDAQNALPQSVVGTVHLNYYDEADIRITQAKALNAWADTMTAAGKPVIVTGDFNAGDVSERGLHSAEQQSYLFARTIMATGSDLWQRLAREYTPEGRAETYQDYAASLRVTGADGKPRYQSLIQAYFDANRDEFPGISSINDMSWRQWETIVAKDMAANGITFTDETYPVASNTPQTMNILKKDFILLQNENERETWAPHAAGDSTTTWPSAAEDQENIWTSWDHAKIDHFLVSRDLGKWYQLADDPADPYLGVLDKTGFANDGTPLSDHEAVAHVLKWTGPALETVAAADGASTRLIWGEEAASFDAQGKVFHLSRNNMRQDVYLGQVADEGGLPTLAFLTEAERQTRLDCGGSDARFAAAVAEYCIDDHSFIAETLVKDGGTVVVDEDAALGSAEARLRLAGGAGLRIDGLAMDRLGRDVALEDKGGFIDTARAEADVTASGVISGTGDLAKRGDGVLRLAGANTYTGKTIVERGTLLVDGSIESSALTTVSGGATIGGTGRIGSLFAGPGAVIAPGDLGLGSLLVGGDLRLDGAVLDIEIGSGGQDLLTVAGNLDALSPFSIRFSFLDNFLPKPTSIFEFLVVKGLGAQNLLDLATLYLPDDEAFRGFSLFGSNGHFALAAADPWGGTDTTPVPLPGAAVALLSALALLGAVRARRA